MYTGRIVLHALSDLDCRDVPQGVGGHPGSTQQDSPSVVLDARGGDPSTSTTVSWQTFFLIKFAIDFTAHRPHMDQREKCIC
jgi:hypothetical protein